MCFVTHLVCIKANLVSSTGTEKSHAKEVLGHPDHVVGVVEIHLEGFLDRVEAKKRI